MWKSFQLILAGVLFAPPVVPQKASNVGVGEPALQFLLHRGEQLWSRIPEVFDVVDSRQLPTPLPPNLTGVTTDVDLGPTIDLALQLLPDRRHFF
jgi:hypothetical protein